MYGKLLFLTLLVQSSVAFLFSRDRITANANGREIDPQCLEHAENGRCDFYSCFEQRLPCGRDWYMLRYGHYYCNKMVSNSGRFSEEGQQFLTNTKQCLTRQLANKYREDTLDCHDLEHHAVDNIRSCFVENGFCDVLNSDAAELSRLYEFSDLFTPGSNKVWRAILRMSLECGSRYFAQFTATARQSIAERFTNLFN